MPHAFAQPVVMLSRCTNPKHVTTAPNQDGSDDEDDDDDSEDDSDEGEIQLDGAIQRDSGDGEGGGDDGGAEIVDINLDFCDPHERFFHGIRCEIQ